MNFTLFKVWVELEGIDLDRITLQRTQRLMKEFENEEKQNSFNYQRAVKRLTTV